MDYLLLKTFFYLMLLSPPILAQFNFSSVCQDNGTIDAAVTMIDMYNNIRHYIFKDDHYWQVQFDTAMSFQVMAGPRNITEIVPAFGNRTRPTTAFSVQTNLPDDYRLVGGNLTCLAIQSDLYCRHQWRSNQIQNVHLRLSLSQAPGETTPTVNNNTVLFYSDIHQRSIQSLQVNHLTLFSQTQAPGGRRQPWNRTMKVYTYNMLPVLRDGNTFDLTPVVGSDSAGNQFMTRMQRFNDKFKEFRIDGIISIPTPGLTRPPVVNDLEFIIFATMREHGFYCRMTNDTKCNKFIQFRPMEKHSQISCPVFVRQLPVENWILWVNFLVLFAIFLIPALALVIIYFVDYNRHQGSGESETETDRTKRTGKEKPKTSGSETTGSTTGKTKSETSDTETKSLSETSEQKTSTESTEKSVEPIKKAKHSRSRSPKRDQKKSDKHKKKSE